MPEQRTQQAYSPAPCTTVHVHESAYRTGAGTSQDPTMLHIWYVIFSSQFCTLSVRAIIAASLDRTTACEWSGFPNAFRWVVHFRHSSTIARCPRADVQHITHRS